MEHGVTELGRLGRTLGDQRIRILHVVASLTRRGAETFAVQLVNGLSRERFDAAIWAINPDSSVPYLIPRHSRLVLEEIRPRGWHRAVGSLVETVNSYRPHLIHCHGGGALKYATLLKPLARAQAYVYTKIGSVHPWLDPPLRHRFYAALFEQVDAIIAVGENVRREMEETFHLRRPRLFTVYPGRDVAPFLRLTAQTAAQKRAEIGLAPSHIVLMTVGSLSWEKDPLSLLRCFAEIAGRDPRLRLVFVGGGPLGPELKADVRRQGLEHKVRLLGVRSDVPALLSAADIFVLPSITEGLPGVLIEAGMAGLPAIAYGVGSVSEVIRDSETGFVVSPQDWAGFSRRMLTLAGDGALRRRMGEASREFCRSTFDIRRSIKQHETLFMEVLEQAARARAAGRRTGRLSAPGGRTLLA